MQEGKEREMNIMEKKDVCIYILTEQSMKKNKNELQFNYVVNLTFKLN